jgi:hypothetical protein
MFLSLNGLCGCTYHSPNAGGFENASVENGILAKCNRATMWIERKKILQMRRKKRRRERA